MSHLSPLKLVSECHFYQSGDVAVHPNAAIAPGVVLQADPGSQLIIAEGVSIAMGAVLHAHNGLLEVEAGVCLGSGVIVVGSGRIGTNACIGSQATILDSIIAPEQVIPSGSLIGDSSRQVPDLQAELTPVAMQHSEPQDAPTVPSNVPPDVPSNVLPTVPSPDQPQVSLNGADAPVVTKKVYGLESFNGLMTSLFPHRHTLNQSLNGTSSNPQPADGNS